jgi:hypothetical protein
MNRPCVVQHPQIVVPVLPGWGDLTRRRAVSNGSDSVGQLVARRVVVHGEIDLGLRRHEGDFDAKDLKLASANGTSRARIAGPWVRAKLVVAEGVDGSFHDDQPVVVGLSGAPPNRSPAAV